MNIDFTIEQGQDVQRKRAAWWTVGINVALLLLLYFVVVWRSPDPPMSRYGMELQLGFSDVGSGNQPSPSPSRQQNTRPEAAAPGEVAPQVVEAPQPKVAPQAQEARANPTPVQPSVQAVQPKPSPVKGTEKPAEQVKPTERKTTAAPTADPKKGEAEETAVVAKEASKVDQRAIFGGGGQSGSANRASTASGAGTDNQAGSAGRAEGAVDGRALMGSGTGQGNPGPASGYNLDLAGWDFASKPDISDRVSTRNGRIVFSITVDDAGKVVQAIPLEYNVSNEVLAYYRTVVNKVSFRRQAGAASADFSTGKITFIIKVD